MHFFNADLFQMIDKFIYQKLTDAFMLVFRINTDGIQGSFLLKDPLLA